MRRPLVTESLEFFCASSAHLRFPVFRTTVTGTNLLNARAPAGHPHHCRAGIPPARPMSPGLAEPTPLPQPLQRLFGNPQAAAAAAAAASSNQRPVAASSAPESPRGLLPHRSRVGRDGSGQIAPPPHSQRQPGSRPTQRPTARTAAARCYRQALLRLSLAPPLRRMMPPARRPGTPAAITTSCCCCCWIPPPAGRRAPASSRAHHRRRQRLQAAARSQSAGL